MILRSSPVAYLSEKMGLISIGTKMSKLYTNKYEMRVFGQKHGFDTPAFFKCDIIDEAIQTFSGVW